MTVIGLIRQSYFNWHLILLDTKPPVYDWRLAFSRHEYAVGYSRPVLGELGMVWNTLEI